MAEAEKATVEIEEAPAPKAEEKITLAEAKEGGLTGKEAEMAKKHGLVVEVKDPVKSEEKKPEPEQEKKAAVKAEEKPADPDLPESYDKYTANEKALYWERKKERTKRQRAEAEKELLQLKLKAAEKELAERKADKLAKEDLNIDDLLDEENPNKSEKKDDKDRPLTVGDLEKREKAKEETEETTKAEQVAKAKELRARLTEFEIEAREKHEDFDAVADMAREVLEKGAALFDGDEDRAELAQARADKALHAMVNAMKWEEGYKTPAELVYDLGRLHPKYKNGAKKSAEKAVPPEQMERMMENAGKRSSASLPGGNGSRRVVSEDELTPEEAAKLSTTQYQKLSKATRERLLRM